MKKQEYTITLQVDNTPKEVFDAINNVAAWWNDFEGSSTKLNDTFTVQFGAMHMSTQKIIAVVPDKKIVWLVTDSYLNFIHDKHEWTNTSIEFEITRHADKTHISFTHVGLVPEVECFKDCSKGWDYYLKGSLFKLLTKGKGTPGL